MDTADVAAAGDYLRTWPARNFLSPAATGCTHTPTNLRPPPAGHYSFTLVFPSQFYCYMSNEMSRHRRRHEHPATIGELLFVKKVKNIGRAYRRQARELIACLEHLIPALRSQGAQAELTK